jgi:UDP-N-acetylglucosamine 3-dehydrogenase
MQQIRGAVLGAGYWGTKQAQEYAAIEAEDGSFNLGWVADSSSEALERLKKELKSDTKYVQDYREVLESDVDAVHIALPNALHYRVAKEALDAGKHVLLEKPMALTSREAFKLVQLADEKGLVLQVGHIFRFNNAVRMVRKIMKEGRVGKVYYLKLEWAASQQPPKETDIVFDLAPHPIDILNFLLDEWPSSVEAVGESYVRGSARFEEMAFINLVYPDTVLANIYVSWIQHGVKDRSIRVVGEKGTVYCDALDQVVRIFDGGRAEELSRASFPSSSPAKRPVGPLPGNEPNNTIRDMQYNFLERIRGRSPQFNSGVVGASTVVTLEAITRAMRKENLHKEIPVAIPWPRNIGNAE